MSRRFLPILHQICRPAHSVAKSNRSSYESRVSWHGTGCARSFANLPTAAKATPPNLVKYRYKTITTLDSTLLSQADFIDLSYKVKPYVYTGDPEDPRTQFFVRFLTTTSDRRTEEIPFPEGTAGFFYCDPHSQTKSPLASEVRFRITKDDKPSSFAQGKDLLLPDSMPWRVPLVVVLTRAQYSGLGHLLLQDRLVTGSDVERCTLLRSGTSPLRNANLRLIHSFGQLFPMDFGAVRGCRFNFLTADAIHPEIIHHLFADLRHNGKRAPYTGSALCCFEQSFLPSHRGTRTMVMRVKKITSPVRDSMPRYDGYLPKPVEGQLVMRPNRGKHTPWSLDIDAKGKLYLQGLFGDSVHPSLPHRPPGSPE